MIDNDIQLDGNTFNLPEGNFRATLTAVVPKLKATPKGPSETVRLLFEVQIPPIDNKLPMAGRNFDVNLKPGSDLRCFVDQWVGVEAFNGKTPTLTDIQRLIGREADVTLKHHCSGRYENPLVLIYNAVPPGTLKLTQEPFIEMAADI